MKSLIFLATCGLANAYWLMGIENFITVERIDPIVNPGGLSGHAHAVLGGSNFGFTTNTAKLRQSDCTSIPIPQDKSNYWFPPMYFQWSNGSFSSLNGGAVIYYLFGDKPGTTTAFPADASSFTPQKLRMISGDPLLRTYDPNSFAQQAVTYLCLDFNGVSTRHNSLPAKACPSGIRAQINFPSCWDGKNVDSPDHKSHVAFLSEGADKGSCTDPKFPVTLPRIFIEVYWDTVSWAKYNSQAKNPSQPFVFSHGDPTGYGYHADFINGWDDGVLQRAVDKCHCNPYGDPACCVQQGIFDMVQNKHCYITKSVDEQVLGTLAQLPGNNPVQPEGTRAKVYAPTYTPAILSPVYAYTGNSAPTMGTTVTPAHSGAANNAAPTLPKDAPTTTSPSTFATATSQSALTSSGSAATSSSSPPTSSSTTSSSRPSSTGSGDNSNTRPPTTGPSDNSGSAPGKSDQTDAKNPDDKAATCDLAEFHKKYRASKNHHGRSLRRTRRSHSFI